MAQNGRTTLLILPYIIPPQRCRLVFFYVSLNSVSVLVSARLCLFFIFDPVVSPKISVFVSTTRTKFPTLNTCGGLPLSNCFCPFSINLRCWTFRNSSTKNCLTFIKNSGLNFIKTSGVTLVGPAWGAYWNS